MATRDHQGLQIALILFILLSLTLAVFAFVFYNKAGKQAQLAAEAQASQAAAQQERDLYYFKTQALKYMLGADAVTKADVDALRQTAPQDKIADIAAIEKQYQQHVAMYGAGLQPAEQNYTAMVNHLGDELRKAHLALATEQNEQKQLIASKQATEKKAQDSIQAALQAQQDAAQRLAKAEQEFQQYKAQLDKEKTDLLAQVRAKDDQLQQLQAQFNQQQQQLQDQIARLQNQVQMQAQKLQERELEAFEMADGQIVWANQRQRSVWINLGSADGLRREMTFSVYDQSKNGVALGESKGSIEVTRVVKEHLAEAKILEDEPSNPILPGDLIHTPAWSPGRKLHFALAGVIDLDGDNKSDLELVRNIILRNDGVIDVVLKEDGSREPPDGHVTAQTRFLVEGSRPDEHTAPELTSAFSRLTEEAMEYGVQRISVDEFLDYMGWRGDVRVVPLGKASQAEDFMKPSEEAKTRTPTGSEAWRKRFAPSSGGDASPF